MIPINSHEQQKEIEKLHDESIADGKTNKQNEFLLNALSVPKPPTYAPSTILPPLKI